MWPINKVLLQQNAWTFHQDQKRGRNNEVTVRRGLIVCLTRFPYLRVLFLSFTVFFFFSGTKCVFYFCLIFWCVIGTKFFFALCECQFNGSASDIVVYFVFKQENCKIV